MVFMLIGSATVGLIALDIRRGFHECDFSTEQQAVEVAISQLKLETPWKKRKSKSTDLRGKIESIDLHSKEHSAVVLAYLDQTDHLYARVFITESCLGQFRYAGLSGGSDE